MITAQELAAMLDAHFAPWVRALAIRIDEVHEDGITVSIPATPEVARAGGTLCGQAAMALADTATALAIARLLGTFPAMTTVGQTTTFLRPVRGERLCALVRVLRLGRTLAYAEIVLHEGQQERPAAHATATYMLLPAETAKVEGDAAAGASSPPQASLHGESGQ